MAVVRCKMSELNVGDVFSFGSNEKYTVRKIEGTYLYCLFMDMGGYNVSNLKRLLIQSKEVECFHKEPVAKAAPKAAPKKAVKPKSSSVPA